MPKMRIPENTVEFEYTNPRKKYGHTGDCVVRALAIAEDMTWEEAYMVLVKEGLRQQKMPNSDTVWQKVLSNLGYRRIVLPRGGNVVTPADLRFVAKKVIVSTRGHVVAITDNKVRDTWDSSDERAFSYYVKGE